MTRPATLCALLLFVIAVRPTVCALGDSCSSDAECKRTVEACGNDGKCVCETDDACNGKEVCLENECKAGDTGTSKGLGGGAIAGIVIGVLIALAAVATGCFFYRQRQNGKGDGKGTVPTESAPSTNSVGNTEGYNWA
eukprot:CAMPEP_0198329908 /NCGR_PEP_ID=MMETSP1450-20131203/16538_1 /TAXON_ID=753684 ORGANISM="Madagascaria erythrocladiodes, Strain CCMP3234" /NCGR_SAMPLE_ID=MMETSP1450 /ASSEMBLY_ACC=CAM_ASM_001115 /LENGTH=137 /DNA_ID=CAMNT_0044034167 /DNA_START=186 /DNA_END=599 /DNA_ORIENTATION=-